MSQPFISVVIPVFQGEGVVERTVTRLQALKLDAGRVIEFIVVDDGSRDATLSLVRSAAPRIHGLRLLRHAENRGKGAAVRTGMLAAKGDIVLFSDVDLSVDVDQWVRVLATLEAGTDIAIASRDLDDSARIVDQPWHRRLLGHAYQATCRLRLGLDYRDTQCGLKAFTREAAQAVFSRSRVEGWAFDVEALVIARELGLRVREVGVEWRDAPGSKVRPLRDLLRVWRDIGEVGRRCRTGEYR